MAIIEQEIESIDRPRDDEWVKKAVECLLFVSEEPVTAAQMASALEVDEQSVEDALYELILDLGQRGLQISRIAGGYQMCTRSEFSEVCQRILVKQNQKLSRAAFETLAVIAYRQPVTQPEVEAIRGVDSNGVMKKLMDRGLIKEVGRKQTAGRPIMYGTTPKFLEHLGLNDLSDLPDIDSLAVEQVRELEAQRDLFTDGEIAISVPQADPAEVDEDSETSES